MGLLVSLVLATCAMVIAYGLLGWGGPICALVFLAILFTGATLRVVEPLLAKLKS